MNLLNIKKAEKFEGRDTQVYKINGRLKSLWFFFFKSNYFIQELEGSKELERSIGSDDILSGVGTSRPQHY